MEWKKKAAYQGLSVLIDLITPFLTVRNIVGAVWMAVSILVIVLLITRGISWLGL